MMASVTNVTIAFMISASFSRRPTIANHTLYTSSRTLPSWFRCLRGDLSSVDFRSASTFLLAFFLTYFLGFVFADYL